MLKIAKAGCTLHECVRSRLRSIFPGFQAEYNFSEPARKIPNGWSFWYGKNNNKRKKHHKGAKKLKKYAW